MPFMAPVDEVGDVSLAALDGLFTRSSPADGNAAVEPALFEKTAPERPRRRPRTAPKRRHKRRADRVDPTVH